MWDIAHNGSIFERSSKHGLIGMREFRMIKKPEGLPCNTQKPLHGPKKVDRQADDAGKRTAGYNLDNLSSDRP
jgi:hypothetical protein